MSKTHSPKAPPIPTCAGRGYSRTASKNGSTEAIGLSLVLSFLRTGPTRETCLGVGDITAKKKQTNKNKKKEQEEYVQI